jgi:hypothetical protein
MRNITSDDLVLYLYNETPFQRMKGIKAAIAGDWSLSEAFEQIVSVKNQLEEVDLSPRQEAVKKILDHANKTISQLHSL